MPQWNGKSKGNKLGYSIFLLILNKGGLKPAYFLLRFVRYYYIFFVPKVTKPLMDLYVNKLHFSTKKAKGLVKQNIYIFGQTIIDKIAVMSGMSNQFTVDHNGGEYLDQLVADGKGGILVSAHLGNWELAGHLLKRLNTVINIVMYDGEAAKVKEYIEKVTGPKTFNIIYVTENMSHVYEISAALARNEFVCIHADRYLKGNRIISTEFLGQKAYFPLGPFILASKLRAPVCFVFAFKASTYHYDFWGFPPKVYEGRGTTGAEIMLKDYVSLLEMEVKNHPEQWFNYFDFWTEPEA